MLGLAELAQLYTTIKAGSEQFLANLDYPNYLNRSKRLQNKWCKLSERLLTTEPRNLLCRQLNYFAQGGGINKLRELIQNHVATHGLKQLNQDTQRSADVISQQQEQLTVIIAEVHEQGIPTADNAA